MISPCKFCRLLGEQSGTKTKLEVVRGVKTEVKTARQDVSKEEQFCHAKFHFQQLQLAVEEKDLTVDDVFAQCFMEKEVTAKEAVGEFRKRNFRDNAK